MTVFGEPMHPRVCAICGMGRRARRHIPNLFRFGQGRHVMVAHSKCWAEFRWRRRFCLECGESPVMNGVCAQHAYLSDDHIARGNPDARPCGGIDDDDAPQSASMGSLRGIQHRLREAAELLGEHNDSEVFF